MKQKILLIFLVFSMTGLFRSSFGAPTLTPEDLAREAAMAEFSKKMVEANYPALFEKAAKEFNVPVQILEAVSFAETRWEHFIWPEGETVSPENGMPRPYGIMSLWDNEFFGHNLIEAASLIGKTPDDLKRDPLDNMRGAAAYLRQLYDKTPKPGGTAEVDLESWRYAITEYCGIPERDLKHQHGLEVYEHLNQGFNQYGIKLEAVPGLKLEPMRAEVKKIKEEERLKREARFAAQNAEAVPPASQPTPPPTRSSNAAAQKTGPTTHTNTVATVAASTPRKNGLIWVVILFVAGAAVFFLGKYVKRKKS